MIDNHPETLESPEELLNNVWIIRLLNTNETLISFADLGSPGGLEGEEEEMEFGETELNLFLPHTIVKDGDDFVLEMFCPFVKDQLIPIDLMDIMFVKTNPCKQLKDLYLRMMYEDHGDLIKELEEIAYESMLQDAQDFHDPDVNPSGLSFYIEQSEPEKFPN